MVNHYYVYSLDRDFGPLFLKFCSYFPSPAPRCLHGHEWLKRQLTQRQISFEPLDNGIQSSAAKIEAVFRKWLRRLPQPFAPAPRAAGYRYQLSILQAKFALTQVLDRPVTGRWFFEDVIRETLDLSRPDQMPLIFNRRVTRRTPGTFRTRVWTEGVVPSLHVQYKHSKVKQDHKEGQALRNLPALREIGFTANRRVLHVESLSHDCLIGEDRLHAVTSPVLVEPHRAAGLRFGDPRTHALMQALCLVARAPTGAQIAMFYARLSTRALRPACSLQPAGSARAHRAFARLDAALATFLEEVTLAA